MTELSDYKRMVEAPMIEGFRRKIAGLEARATAAEASLKAVAANLNVAQSLMMEAGTWTNSAGYLTDTALWIDRAMKAALSPPDTAATVSSRSLGEGG